MIRIPSASEHDAVVKVIPRAAKRGKNDHAIEVLRLGTDVFEKLGCRRRSMVTRFTLGSKRASRNRIRGTIHSHSLGSRGLPQLVADSSANLTPEIGSVDPIAGVMEPPATVAGLYAVSGAQS